MVQSGPDLASGTGKRPLRSVSSINIPKKRFRVVAVENGLRISRGRRIFLQRLQINEK
jgi:hypothetical protein